METGKGGADGYNRSGTIADSGIGFEFGFNDAKFSDRILGIEILPDPPNAKSSNRTCGEGCLLQSILFDNSWLFTLCSPRSDRVLDGNETDQDHNEESSSSSARPTVLRVKTVRINSLMLAAKSPFFYKMFSNGMRESKQQKISLQIYAFEETALMDLLQFTYSSKLQANTPTSLLDVLMLADKYEVTSCIGTCGLLLQKFPLNCELALSYVDLPSSVLTVESVSQLVAAAKSFLAKVSKNITTYPEEAIKLPLDRVKDALSSEELRVASEDEAYDFFLKWVTTHFPSSNDRQEILRSQLCQCIRFPFLSCQKLREVLTCSDLDPIISSKIVSEALFFKAERLDQQRSLMEAKFNKSLDFSYVERAYNLHPVKVIEFDAPFSQCIVHMDLKKEVFSQINLIRSQDFYISGNQFHLEVSRNRNESTDWFGMYIFRKGQSKQEGDPVTIQYEFAAREKTNGKFKTLKFGNYKFSGNDSCGFYNLFDISWDLFLRSPKIPYFINNVLYLRADVTIEKVEASPSEFATRRPMSRSGR